FLCSLTATALSAFDPLSLHDALPISLSACSIVAVSQDGSASSAATAASSTGCAASPRFFAAASSSGTKVSSSAKRKRTIAAASEDRKSTRLNSSHLGISYAVFCLKKK